MRKGLRSRAAAGDDTGAVALIVAISAMTLVLAAAMVIDFGIVRMDRTINKASADAAAAAGIRSVASGDGRPRAWRGVCDALAYLAVNNPEFATLNAASADWTRTWTTGQGTVVSGDPCTNATYRNLGCDGTNSATWARFTASTLATVGQPAQPRLTVRLLSAYQVADAGTSADPAGVDQGDPAQGGCDQIGVLVTEARQPGLGSLATSGALVTHTRSVSRVTIGTQGEAVVALVLLEREGCPTLRLDGSTVIFRSGASGDRPGMIHSDSLAQGCGTNSRVYEVENGVDRIFAEHAVTGTGLKAQGVIGSAALVDNPASTNIWSGSPGERVRAESDPAAGLPLSAQKPIARPMVTRRPVDNRYLAAVRQVMNDAAATWTSPAGGYTVVNLPSNCRLDAAVLGTAGASARVFVNCPSASQSIDVEGDLAFTGSDTVVFNRPVSVTNTNALRIRDAQRVFVNGGVSVTNSAQFQVNHDGSAGACAALAQPAADDKRAVMVLNNALSAQTSSVTHLCNTSVILAKCQPLSATAVPADYPPTDNNCTDSVSVSAQATVYWTAPDTKGATATALDHAKLEDLALWGESSGTVNASLEHRLTGSGAMQLSGLYFLPNANAFRVGGSSAVDVMKAQFVVRRLTLAGSSTFRLLPDPEDAVTVPYFGDFTLVR
jgi:hypothetical protein